MVRHRERVCGSWIASQNSGDNLRMSMALMLFVFARPKSFSRSCLAYVQGKRPAENAMNSVHHGCWTVGFYRCAQRKVVVHATTGMAQAHVQPFL